LNEQIDLSVTQQVGDKVYLLERNVECSILKFWKRCPKLHSFDEVLNVYFPHSLLSCNLLHPKNHIFFEDLLLESLVAVNFPVFQLCLLGVG